MEEQEFQKDALLQDYHQAFEQQRYQDRLLAFQFYVAIGFAILLFSFIVKQRLCLNPGSILIWLLGTAIFVTLFYSVAKSTGARDAAANRAHEIESMVPGLLAHSRIFQRPLKGIKRVTECRHFSVAKAMQAILGAITIGWFIICIIMIFFPGLLFGKVE